ncbi:hypothetical protein KKF70_07565 [bacterium]|nr:hypothetical protein [bacterium]MBU3930496.1 hypothetical protein [bacterium]
MNVLICPFSDRFANNKLFFANERDNCLGIYRDLKENLERRNIVINTIDAGNIKQADFIIFFNLDNVMWIEKCLEYVPTEKLILILKEPPSLCPQNYDKYLHALFGQIGAWMPSLIDNKRYFYFPIFVNRYSAPAKKSFQEKKMLTAIFSNKMNNHKLSLYSGRIKAIRYFEENCPDNFDLFGMGWHQPRTFLQKRGVTPVPHYSSYRGVAESKQDILSRYKFSICYENSVFPGYVTEKIFDSLQARCIPVYLGASDIEKYVPSDIFIDKRKFATYKELCQFIENMTEQEYEGYIERIENYLSGEQFTNFLSDKFSKTIIEFIERKNIQIVNRKAWKWGVRKIKLRILKKNARRVLGNVFRKVWLSQDY